MAMPILIHQNHFLTDIGLINNAAISVFLHIPLSSFQIISLGHISTNELLFDRAQGFSFYILNI